jgi:hypothetical protein
VERLSEQLDPEHQRFRHLYFADLSFLLAGLILGTPEALRLKFTLVKEGLPIGRPDRLDEVLLNLEGRGDLFI